jgi:hypothetical protein
MPYGMVMTTGPTMAPLWMHPWPMQRACLLPSPCCMHRAPSLQCQHLRHPLSLHFQAPQKVNTPFWTFSTWHPPAALLHLPLYPGSAMRLSSATKRPQPAASLPQTQVSTLFAIELYPSLSYYFYSRKICKKQSRHSLETRQTGSLP